MTTLEDIFDLSTMSEINNLFDELEKIDLSEFNNQGLELNLSTVINDGNIEVGAHYKDSNGIDIDIHEAGDNLVDVLNNCAAQLYASVADADADEVTVDDEKDKKILELENRIKELEADLAVQRARNEKTVNKKAQHKSRTEKAYNSDIKYLRDMLKRF